MLMLCVVALLCACSARLIPPDPPEEPRQVVVLEHGRHTSVVLFDAQQVPWRFAYGDRSWYVEGERGAGAAGQALLRDSQAVIGRRALSSPEPAGWVSEVGSLITAAVPFRVEAGRVDALLATLHGYFDAAADVVFAPHLGLEVVEHPQAYRLGHNSNHKVAEWLQAVGVEVRGNPAIGRWRHP